LAVQESDSSHEIGGAFQVRIALRNCGQIDPQNIDHYIARGGYDGLERALKMTAAEVIEEIRRSGLRETGGSRFSIVEKWRLCLEAPGNEKMLICNAAEGDPDSLIARTLLTEDPHSVLEGMLIGAYAAGASLGIIYIDAEYGLAIDRLRTALKQAEGHGFIGKSISDSDVSFRIEIKEGTGRLACGDETFLINAIEGKQTMPFACSSRPLISGLGGKPALVHPVETWARVSAILEKGAAWYAGYGIGQGRGAKVFTLSGEVRHPGVFEVPVAMTLRQIVYDVGGGISDEKELKAVQIGGPAGGYLPASLLDLPVDDEPLSDAGTFIGSGTIFVLNRNACMVDRARGALSFIEHESCGKCVFCREGTMQMADILSDITEGKGKAGDIALLVELGEGLKSGAQCNLGRAAPDPVLTLIRYFRGELEAHIKEKRCQAQVCDKLDLR
jgi:NADH:ubiquinone oxidoreductase subunit F (NADH-binding)